MTLTESTTSTFSDAVSISRRSPTSISKSVAASDTADTTGSTPLSRKCGARRLNSVISDPVPAPISKMESMVDGPNKSRIQSVLRDWRWVSKPLSTRRAWRNLPLWYMGVFLLRFGETRLRTFLCGGSQWLLSTAEMKFTIICVRRKHMCALPIYIYPKCIAVQSFLNFYSCLFFFYNKHFLEFIHGYLREHAKCI